MKTLALMTIGIAALGGGLECIAVGLRAEGFEATVSNKEIWVEAKKPVSDKQIGAIPNLVYISSIRLLEGGFTDSGVAKLKKLDGLKTLVLNSKDLTDEATVSISKLRSIEKLDLMGAKLTASGLARLGSLPHLRQLYLHSANVEAKDLLSLKKFKDLQVLTLPDRLGATVLDDMRRSLPNAHVSAPTEGS